MRGAKGDVNPVSLFFGENMSMDTGLRFMGEKHDSMPSFKDPRELTHAVTNSSMTTTTSATPRRVC